MAAGILLLALLLSLAETPESVPAPRGRGGWTLNSAVYLLGRVVPLSHTDGQGGKREAALEILALWKAIEGLPYSHPQQASKRSPMETFSRPDIGDLDTLGQTVPREDRALQS